MILPLISENSTLWVTLMHIYVNCTCVWTKYALLIRNSFKIKLAPINIMCKRPVDLDLRHCGAQAAHYRVDSIFINHSFNINFPLFSSFLVCFLVFFCLYGTNDQWLGTWAANPDCRRRKHISHLIARRLFTLDLAFGAQTILVACRLIEFYQLRTSVGDV